MSSTTSHTTEVCPISGDGVDIYVWNISSTSQLTISENQAMRSPIFELKSLDSKNHSFFLEFYPYFAYGSKILTILKFISSNKDSLIPFETIINNNEFSEKGIQMRKNVENYQSGVYNSEYYKLGAYSFDFDVAREMTITIKIKTVNENFHPSKYEFIPEYKNELTTGLLYLENEKFSDIILEVDGKELKAHKIVLSLKSPVFAAMFDHESMKESKDKRVVIDDIDFPVVKQMLEYIYTENITSKIDDCVHDLMKAANNYQIDKLKGMCENNLTKKITVENVLDIVVVADLYDARTLKKNALKFLEKHVSIIDTADFKKIKHQNANLAVEILEQFIPRK